MLHRLWGPSPIPLSFTFASILPRRELNKATIYAQQGIQGMQGINLPSLCFLGTYGRLWDRTIKAFSMRSLMWQPVSPTHHLVCCHARMCLYLFLQQELQVCACQGCPLSCPARVRVSEVSYCHSLSTDMHRNTSDTVGKSCDTERQTSLLVVKGVCCRLWKRSSWCLSVHPFLA